VSAPPARPPASFVVAWDRPRRNLAAWAAFARELGEAVPGAELLLVARAGERPALEGPGVRHVEAPAGALVPRLWAAGLRAASAESVALTTTHFLPTPAWARAVAALEFDDDAGVGGPIRCAPDSDGRGWAIWIQRYAAYAPPLPAGPAREIAADDAVYRRSLVLAHEDLLAEGFWEPGFHARFARDGHGLRLSGALELTFRNELPARAFCTQRVAHGREYGFARAGAMGGARRWAYAAASPLVPLVLGAKLLGRTGRLGLPAAVRLRAAPWLALFLLAWALGEGTGALRRAAGASSP